MSCMKVKVQVQPIGVKSFQKEARILLQASHSDPKRYGSQHVFWRQLEHRRALRNVIYRTTLQNDNLPNLSFEDIDDHNLLHHLETPAGFQSVLVHEKRRGTEHECEMILEEESESEDGSIEMNQLVK